MPTVNIDGVKLISDHFDERNQFPLIRKNRHIFWDQRDCNIELQGVDLNRNYGFKFGYDNIGSSRFGCWEDFRGSNAFSEPETQAMRDFVIDYNNIRVAINLHAWGPMFITPFNFDNDQNDLLSDNHLKAQAFYDNIFYNDVSPLGYTYGNGAITIGYTANGEASDWMLGVRGIYAISPEIGT